MSTMYLIKLAGQEDVELSLEDMLETLPYILRMGKVEIQKVEVADGQN